MSAFAAMLQQAARREMEQVLRELPARLEFAAETRLPKLYLAQRETGLAKEKKQPERHSTDAKRAAETRRARAVPDGETGRCYAQWTYYEATYL